MAYRVIASLLASLLTTPALAEKPRAAVLPLQAQGVDQKKVQILDGLLVAELDAVGRYDILGANDLNAVLGFERMRDAVGCSDVACAAEIGGALGVRFLVSGTVSVLGEELIVQLNLTDVKAVAVLERGRAVVVNQDKHYRRAIELAVADLFDLTPRESAPPARIEDENALGPAFSFQTAEPGREFKVIVTTSDGRQRLCASPVTLANQCVLRGLSGGDAHIAITAPPLSAFTDTVDVDWEDVAAVGIMEIPAPISIVMWGLGGTAAAVGTALAGVGGGIDNSGMLTAGLITLGVGLGAVIGAFFIEGNIAVDYPGVDFFFSM